MAHTHGLLMMMHGWPNPPACVLQARGATRGAATPKEEVGSVNDATL